MILSELLKGLDSSIIQGEDREIQKLTIDSRTAEKDSFFICIQGLQADGHDYIEKAAESGAAAVLCDRALENYPEGLTVVQVPDSRAALPVIASNFYGKPEQSLFLIGVTGTNGKTSTTYFLETILKTDGRKCGIIGTTGAIVDGKALDIPYLTSTTPDIIELYQMLAEMKKRGVSYILMEVSSHALALKKVDGLTFEAGVFTNLTQDHLDFHETFDAYFEAKAKLFKLCRWAVVNADDGYAEKLLSRIACRKMTYSIAADSDFRARNIESTENGSRFDLVIFGDKYPFELTIPGKFSVYNVLGAIAVCINLGISVRTIIDGVARIKNVPGRIQPIPNKKGFSVFVDYAHSPDGLENIISAVRGFTKGRVITVFGCGGDKDTAKRPIMGEIAGRLSDFCVLTSDNPRSENPDAIIDAIEKGITGTGCEYIKLADRRAAVFDAIGRAKPGDSVIIAGKGHEDYQEFEQKRRIRFDDTEVAKEALEGLS